MSEIVLEECFDGNGKYLGRIVVEVKDLSAEFIGKIKADKEDKMGYKKYKTLLKGKGYDV